MNIGARTLKTSLAVALSVYFCMLLNLEPALFAATSAVVSMQQSIGRSFRDAFEQIVVNLMAIGVGIVLGLMIPVLFISMAISTIIVILCCIKIFNMPNRIVLAVISSIIILASPQDQFLEHAMTRSLVLLVGIVVANLINITISPPHYRKVLEKKVINLNNFVIQAFSDSLNRYMHLNLPTEEEVSKNSEEFFKLFEDAEHLFELYREEWKIPLRNTPGKKREEEKLLEEYLDYNRGLWQRSQDVLFLAGERKIRREDAPDPEISSEYNRIFEMLLNVMFNASCYNLELQKKIKGEEAQIYPEPRVWKRLNDFINQWHDKNPTTNYYTHALMEVSIITYNIRWFAKESARILNG